MPPSLLWELKLIETILRAHKYGTVLCHQPQLGHQFFRVFLSFWNMACNVLTLCPHLLVSGWASQSWQWFRSFFLSSVCACFPLIKKAEAFLCPQQLLLLQLPWCYGLYWFHPCSTPIGYSAFSCRSLQVFCLSPYNDTPLSGLCKLLLLSKNFNISCSFA